jgi:hypothetical protein
MSTQLAEGLLAVLWLDRCRQVQRLTQGRTKEFREEVVRELLTAFIAEQRWGLGPNTVDDEGVVYAEGVLNFEGMRGPGDYWVEELILSKIMVDIEHGAWMPIEGYMRRVEFFGGFPSGSLRRLPVGAHSR